MRPTGRIATYMSFRVLNIGRILGERLVSVDAKFSNARRVGTSHELWIVSASRTQTLKNPNAQTLLSSVFRTMFPRRATRLARCGILYQKFGRAGSSFRGSQKIGEKGGVERKLALALVRSFFALSIRDNYLLFSLSTLGSYHWLRTIRLLRLQKTNSSLAPLPLRFAAKCEAPSRSLRREKPPRPWEVGRDHRTRRLRNENPMRNILKLNRQCCFKHFVSHICF